MIPRRVRRVFCCPRDILASKDPMLFPHISWAGLLERSEGRGDDCANALQALLLRQTVLARNILNQIQRFGERWKLVCGEDDSIDIILHLARANMVIVLIDNNKS